ncbi:MAG TPA: tetratricopeptide repeat protein [Rhizomicrobium sp.]|nr:tetratricopeptide repeat protein [Rhizomicrobium sp.]
MRARVLFSLAFCAAGALVTGCASAPSGEEIKTTFDAGLKDYDAGDYRAAYDKWRSIDQFDLAALRNVALMLRKGEGVPKDPKAAEALMAEAADAGLATAQADLADMLIKGEAGPPDPKAAVPWLARAASAGHPLAAFELARMYEEGTVVKQDIEQARKLYKLAAAAGVDGAQDRLKALPPEPDPPLRH